MQTFISYIAKVKKKFYLTGFRPCDVKLNFLVRSTVKLRTHWQINCFNFIIEKMLLWDLNGKLMPLY